MDTEYTDPKQTHMISNAKIGQSLISNGEHTRVECRAYNILQWNIGYTTYYSGM